MKIKIKRLLSKTVGFFFKLRGARILYFHSTHPYHPLAIHPDKFRRISELALETGKEIITIAELGRRLRENLDIHNCISFTFDDGYADNIDYALPILNDLNIKATFFIVAGLINDIQWVDDEADKKHHLYFGLPLMKKDDIRELSSIGMEIGSHGLSHRFMKHEKYEIVKSEILLSKFYLEKVIKKPVISFSFPNGEIPTFGKQLLEESGYLQAVSTIWGCVSYQSDLFCLPRQIVDYNMNEDDFKSIFLGKYDWLRLVQIIKNRVRHSK